MTTVATSLVLLWVLLCFGLVGICVPLAALGGVAGSRRGLLLNVGPALVCTWLTLGITVPLAAACWRPLATEMVTTRRTTRGPFCIGRGP